MILHNDIWGDTSVTLIEEIDNQFLIVRELNMLALYSRLNKEQSHALQQALATFYEILFSSKDKDKIDDTVPFTPLVALGYCVPLPRVFLFTECYFTCYLRDSQLFRLPECAS